jgi:hypothetical protein
MDGEEERQPEDYVDAEDLPKEYTPDGYESADKFIEYVIEQYDADIEFDSDNREAAMEDLKFLAGDQWDPEVLEDREGRPCLTINVLPQFVGQVVGDRRLNKTSIKVAPLKFGTKEIADIRSGLIKSIEAASRAERVYDAALEDQVACGISNFRVDLEYADNDVFDQDIILRHIPNALAVVWDRMSIDPTGRDARHCFVTDMIPEDVYDKKFGKDHPRPTGLGTRDDAEINRSKWIENKSVRITEFWEIIQKPAKFAMMDDGDIKDVTDKPLEEYADKLWRHPQTGEPKIRDSFRSYARMHLVTSFGILSEAYEVPLSRLPIIRVEGRVVRVGDDRMRFGLVRFAKDSQRLKNYWRSTAAETIALAPKAQWAGPADAFEGREEEWQRSNVSRAVVLKWNSNTQSPPQRLDPPRVPEAFLQESALNQQDIKDTTGIHDASLGLRSNEVSGKAIQARQSEGDVATVIYHDNLNYAIQEGGDVVNQLIPVAYDASRIVRIIGEDDKSKLLLINDPDDDESPDITTGKYDVSLETGPSFTTQRKEAMDAMITLVQTSPELMGVIGDLIFKHADFPGAIEVYERLRKTPGISQFLDEDEEGGEQQQQEPTQEEQIQQQMAMKQIEAAMAEMEAAEMTRQLEIKEREQKLRAAEAQATEAEAKARQAIHEEDAAEAKAQEARVQAQYAPRLAQSKLRLAESSASAKGASEPRGAKPKGRAKKGNTNDT